jgi:hypothetical protein
VTLALQAALFAIQLILLVWVGVFLVRTLRRMYSGHGDAPFIPTPSNAFTTIMTALDIGSSDIVYELGSGDGRFLLFCASREPSARYIGIEHNFLLSCIARTRQWLSGIQNVEFRRGNFYNTDISEATKLYAYLLPSVMDRMLPSLERQFTGRLASRAFRFKERDDARIVALSERPGFHGEHQLFVYDFKE